MQIESFKPPSEGLPEGKKRVLQIEARLLCARDSQKGILIGKGGEALKRCGTLARHRLEELYEVQVNLRLRVKVEKNWRKKDDVVARWGYGT